MAKEILKDFSLFVDGHGYAGAVDEVSPPKLVQQVMEINNGGMSAPIEEPTGRVEKMELGFSLTSYDPTLIRQFGLAPGNATQITLRGVTEDEYGEKKPVKINGRGFLRELDRGTWKPAQVAALKGVFSLRYYREEVDGIVVHEIDPPNGVFIVNGVDIRADYRKHLGI